MISLPTFRLGCSSAASWELAPSLRCDRRRRSFRNPKRFPFRQKPAPVDTHSGSRFDLRSGRLPGCTKAACLLRFESRQEFATPFEPDATGSGRPGWSERFFVACVGEPLERLASAARVPCVLDIDSWAQALQPPLALQPSSGLLLGTTRSPSRKWRSRDEMPFRSGIAQDWSTFRQRRPVRNNHRERSRAGSLSTLLPP